MVLWEFLVTCDLELDLQNFLLSLNFKAMHDFLAAPPQSISVLLCDSSRTELHLLTEALRRDVDFRVAGCPLEPDAIATAVASQTPQAAILSFAGSNPARALGVLRAFQRSHPRIPKILLLDSPTRDLIVAAFRSGARGIFCLSEQSFHDLCKCIARVAAGQVWIDTAQLNVLLDLITETPALNLMDSKGRCLLTPRQQQVVTLVAEGLSNREIAAELHLSQHTVKKYLFRIFEVLGISTRVELVLYAVGQTEVRAIAE